MDRFVVKIRDKDWTRIADAQGKIAHNNRQDHLSLSMSARGLVTTHQAYSFVDIVCPPNDNTSGQCVLQRESAQSAQRGPMDALGRVAIDICNPFKCVPRIVRPEVRPTAPTANVQSDVTHALAPPGSAQVPPPPAGQNPQGEHSLL